MYNINILAKKAKIQSDYYRQLQTQIKIDYEQGKREKGRIPK